MEPEQPPPPAQPRAAQLAAPVSPPRIADATPARIEPAPPQPSAAAAAVSRPPSTQEAPAAATAKQTAPVLAAAAPVPAAVEVPAVTEVAHATGNGVSKAQEGAAPVAVTSRVLRLANMVTREELLDPEEYSDIVDDITSELESKYGTLSSLVIPQPSQKGPASDPSGVGLVFVQFPKLSDAVKAQEKLNGRKFGAGNIHSEFFDEGLFQRKHF
ncbi:hypothetical protein COCSUDRAFT_54348 [Coccomyxa subellipsoidea C-169]|uniref:RRM domain-containing protein n=1 Tax=Coccomyxa subellipsoidea (strain C-169) TaxID=574566 RepID=I0YQ69_COCSC|nr:hypothetical protein COCSUDRAFT_54348 [Coccomyxa subellipsoidea C-169]EIE20538.1 hypothetical protein COCSUDRAFT_54348 [Coccomyxa subellipsoidea C-169]|eukprot:XP_005645082.1 hypothetical protein COCSUDRAFT_54348 [Coccomyxa subellipsoidea C-169]